MSSSRVVIPEDLSTVCHAGKERMEKAQAKVVEKSQQKWDDAYMAFRQGTGSRDKMRTLSKEIDKQEDDLKRVRESLKVPRRLTLA